MDWFVVLAPVPRGAVEFGIGGAVAMVTTLVLAVAPLLLALRSTLARVPVAPPAAQLRVIEGGKEPRQQAA